MDHGIDSEFKRFALQGTKTPMAALEMLNALQDIARESLPPTFEERAIEVAGPTDAQALPQPPSQPQFQIDPSSIREEYRKAFQDPEVLRALLALAPKATTPGVQKEAHEVKKVQEEKDSIHALPPAIHHPPKTQL